MIRLSRKVDWFGEQLPRKDLSSTIKIVLFALVEYSNADGRCFPGLDRLAKDCAVSRSTVAAALKTLIEKGLITRRKRQDSDGRQRSSVYFLNIDGSEIRTGESSQLDGGGSEELDGGGSEELDTELSHSELSHSEETGASEKVRNPEPPEPSPTPSAPPEREAGTTSTKTNGGATTKQGNFRCSSCRCSQISWFGRCPMCGEWNTMAEIERKPKARKRPSPRRKGREPPKQYVPPPPPKPETELERRVLAEYPRVGRPGLVIEMVRQIGVGDQDLEALLKWAAIKRESKQWRDGFAPELHSVIRERLWEVDDAEEEQPYYPG